MIQYPSSNWFLKDPDTLSSFAQSKIISEILYLAWFEDRHSQGPVLSEYFNLIPLEMLALIFTMVCTFLYHHILFLLFQQIDFCLHEWSTGTFLQAMFFEKDVIHTHKIYQAEVEAWSNINLAVMLNIRKKLFTCALYVHHFIPSWGFWPHCPFLVIIPVWLAKRPPLFPGLLVKPKIGFKRSLMAELGIQIVSYQPRYIWVFDSYIYFAWISQYIFPFLCLPWMYGKINIVSRSGSWCRHEVLSVTPSISGKWGATGKLLMSTAIQGKTTGPYYQAWENYWSNSWGGTCILVYYRYCSYVGLLNQVIFPDVNTTLHLLHLGLPLHLERTLTLQRQMLSPYLTPQQQVICHHLSSMLVQLGETRTACKKKWSRSLGGKGWGHYWYICGSNIKIFQ